MTGVHDVGGRRGFGPVPVDDDDDTGFHADWEARIYGIYRVLAAKGLINEHDMRWAVERIDPQTYLEAGYYERWVDAIELLAAEKGLVADA
jgi:nitrile hydratase